MIKKNAAEPICKIVEVIGTSTKSWERDADLGHEKANAGRHAGTADAMTRSRYIDFRYPPQLDR